MTSFRWRLPALVGGLALIVASRALAQETLLSPYPPFFDLAAALGVSGFGMGAAALVSWGRHGKAVETHDVRLAELEEDRKSRVTREEFKSMQQDIREIRQLLERRAGPRT